MRIAVDLRSFSSEASRRGMGKYTQQQLEAVLHVDSTNQYIGILYDGIDSSLDLRYFWSRPNFSFVPLNAGIKVNSLIPAAEYFRYINSLNELLAALRIDVFHHTTPFMSPNARFVSGVVTVSTLYDLIPLIYAADYLTDDEIRAEYFEQLQTVYESSHVVAISNSAKQDLISYLDFPESAVSVAYPLTEARFRPVIDQTCTTTLKKLKARIGLPSQFILSVTGVHRSKNLAHLLRAYEHWRRTTEEGIALLIVLPSSFAEGFFRQHFASPVGVHCVSDVTDDELVALYNSAEFVVHASSYEGFGYPVAEAMSCSAAVITTTSSSLPEIAEGACLLVNPEDEDELVVELTRLSSDRSLRETLKRNVATHAGRFRDRDALGRTTVTAYEQAFRFARHSLNRRRLVSTYSALPPYAKVSEAILQHARGRSRWKRIGRVGQRVIDFVRRKEFR